MYLSFRKVADRVLAAVAILILSPLILVGIILAKRDGGPAFFFQERLGKDAKIFHVIKLRTMVVGADKMVDKDGRATQVRITKTGHFLRKSSIDELPQLFNILKGDMATIGPRPILPMMLPYMTAAERKRFDVLPGITGLAQVKGRNFIIWSRRFKLDNVYIKRMSLALDIHIIYRTFITVFTGAGVASEANPDAVNDITTRPLASDV